MPKQITLGAAYQEYLEAGFAQALVTKTGVDDKMAREVAKGVLEGDAVKAIRAARLDPNVMVTIEDDGSCTQVKEIINVITPPPGQRSSGLAKDQVTGLIVTVDATHPQEHAKAAARARHLRL